MRTIQVSAVGLLLSLTGAACAGRHDSRPGPGTSSLIVLDRSIGGVALKEERSDVERRLGRGRLVQAEDERPPAPPSHGEHVRYPMQALDVWYVSRDATPAGRARARVFIVRTTSTRYRTAQGARVGSPAAKLKTLVRLVCALESCQHGYHSARQTGTTFQLDRPGGRVTWIAVSVGGD